MIVLSHLKQLRTYTWHIFLLQAHILPTYGGKHQDLKYISSQTLSQVLEGAYSDQVEKAIVIDCRYPYEFNGGHIEVKILNVAVYLIIIYVTLRPV